jgi:hypothetical protein
LTSIQPVSRINPPFAGVTAVYAMQERRSSTCTIVLPRCSCHERITFEDDPSSAGRRNRSRSLFCFTDRRQNPLHRPHLHSQSPPSPGLDDGGEQSIATVGLHRRFCGGGVNNSLHGREAWSRPCQRDRGWNWNRASRLPPRGAVRPGEARGSFCSCMPGIGCIDDECEIYHGKAQNGRSGNAKCRSARDSRK